MALPNAQMAIPLMRLEEMAEIADAHVSCDSDLLGDGMAELLAEVPSYTQAVR